MVANINQVKSVLYFWSFQRAPSLQEPPGYRGVCVRYEPEANICSAPYQCVNNKAYTVYVCRVFLAEAAANSISRVPPAACTRI